MNPVKPKITIKNKTMEFMNEYDDLYYTVFYEAYLISRVLCQSFGFAIGFGDSVISAP